MSEPTQYTIMGNPVEHSLSPKIHRIFAEQTKQDMIYTATHVPLNAFGAALRQFVASGGQGANVTVPFKHQAYDCMDEHMPNAAKTQHVNTVLVKADGTLVGDNTDGIGFITDVMHNQDEQILGQRILILGAGGASAGILSVLIDAKPSELVIMNRNQDRAKALVDQYQTDAVALDVVKWGEADFAHFDFIIHATSAAVTGSAINLPSGLNLKNSWCYDLSYGPAAQPFMRWAKAQHARKCVDGLGMLVEQAGQSFKLWRGVMPDTRAVLDLLRK